LSSSTPGGVEQFVLPLPVSVTPLDDDDANVVDEPLSRIDDGGENLLVDTHGSGGV